MKKNLLLLCALVMMTASSLRAQNFNRCGTMEYLAAQKAADPGLEARMAEIEKQAQKWIADHPDQKTAAVITIPVVVHVLYNTSSQNVSDARVNEQIHVLNMDFSRTNANAGNTPSIWQGIAANTQIQFCLAQRDPNGNATNGIIHKSTTVTSFSGNNMKFNSSGGDDAWPAGSYLNIWSCNMSGGVLGFAQFPGGSASTDGVAVLYSSVGGPAAPGTLSPYHLGRTATHEVGHWLNLRHINGDATCGSDLVSDTPTQDQLHFGCPNHPYHVNVCSGSSNGEMFMNYMDYTDDACMNMFTAGQSSRMNSTLTGTRASLQSSLGCTPPAGGCGTPSGLNATSVTASSATLNWGAVASATSYNIHYRQTGTTTWTNTTSATTSKAISGLAGSTQYEFQVQAVCNTGSGNYSSSVNFTTLAQACTDTYEPNNGKATSKTIPINTSVVALINPTGDNDYFTITTVAPNTYLRVTLSNLPTDYDLKLFSSAGTLLKTSQHGGTTNEVITRNVTTAATYKIRVYGSGGAFNATQCYTLTTLTSSSPLREMGDEEADSDNSSLVSVYPNPVRDIMNVEVNSSITGIISINIVDMVGRTVLKVQKSASKGMNNFEVSLKDLNKGIYFVDVNNGLDREIKKIIVSK
ncbi:MAG TPA: T9SS type A sorting domain-containing protein [Bacteroidia bacterium]|nr:T9SS type A sorting domain-containing protein [Bacteroidia bacterium]